MRAKFFVAASLPILLSACSMISSPSTARRFESPPNPTLVIDLFAARGFLGGTDYEQYKLVSGTMWRECGNVPGKNSAAAKAAAQNANGSAKNLVPIERRVEDLTDKEQGALATVAGELFRSADTTSEKLPSPGALFSLVEPGMIEISIQMDGKTKRYVTSVDAIAEQQTSLTKALNEIITKTRSIGPVICKSPTFFGIRRKALS